MVASQEVAVHLDWAVDDDAADASCHVVDDVDGAGGGG